MVVTCDLFASVAHQLGGKSSVCSQPKSLSGPVKEKGAAISHGDGALQASEQHTASQTLDAASQPSHVHCAALGPHRDDISPDQRAHKDVLSVARLPSSVRNDVQTKEERRAARRTALFRAMQLAVPPEVRAKPYPETLVPLWSQEGLALLEGSTGRFEAVAAHMLPQGPLQCGVTSLAIGLNVCKQRSDPEFRVADLQEELRAAVRPVHRFFSSSLGEIGALAMRHASAGVSIHYASDTDCNAFRAMASETLEAGGSVIVNFKRREVGYASPFAGHCSPLGAYNASADELLVMDVAQKSFQPVWVPTTTLFRGMDTMEKPRDERMPATKTRGFILLDPVHAPPRFYAEGVGRRTGEVTQTDR